MFLATDSDWKLPDPLKIGIECQKCPHSLTIVYATDDETEDAARTHLANLMHLHYELHYPNEQGKIPPKEEMKNWGRVLKPHKSPPGSP